MSYHEPLLQPLNKTIGERSYILRMYNEKLGEEKNAPMGFSWTTLIFGIWPALFRGDWVGFLIQVVCIICTFGLSVFIWPFYYNGYYIKQLAKKGYIPICDQQTSDWVYRHYGVRSFYERSPTRTHGAKVVPGANVPQHLGIKGQPGYSPQDQDISKRSAPPPLQDAPRLPQHIADKFDKTAQLPLEDIELAKAKSRQRHAQVNGFVDDKMPIKMLADLNRSFKDMTFSSSSGDKATVKELTYDEQLGLLLVDIYWAPYGGGEGRDRSLTFGAFIEVFCISE